MYKSNSLGLSMKKLAGRHAGVASRGRRIAGPARTGRRPGSRALTSGPGPLHPGQDGGLSSHK